jgi:methylase of polypeptide subunit release factors
MATLLAPFRSAANDHSSEDTAVIALLGELKQLGYEFTTPTPTTHARILARRPNDQARNLRDVLGWSLPFNEGLLPSSLVELLHSGGALARLPDGRLRSRMRVSRVADELFVHSAYPTQEKDAVFLGPDSYRFASLIRRELTRCPKPAGSRLVDIGAGAGVGAITAARQCPGLQISMTDINSRALRFARINAHAASIQSDFALGRGLSETTGDFALILANPPYIIDDVGRDYRDGGGMHGGQIAYEMADEGLSRLEPQGRFILYSGSAIVAGRDNLRDALEDLSVRRNCALEYQELDPDVFGEELERPAYYEVDRIAVIAAVLTRP